MTNANNGLAAHLAAVDVVDGVAYELHHSARVRVLDVDSNEVVTMVFYPTMAAAAAAYAVVVAGAKAVA